MGVDVGVRVLVAVWVEDFVQVNVCVGVLEQVTLGFVSKGSVAVGVDVFVLVVVGVASCIHNNFSDKKIIAYE